MTTAPDGVAPVRKREDPVSLWIVLGALSLMLMFGPSLRQHVLNSADPLQFNDDARQWIPWLFADADPSLFRNDYIARYYRTLDPVGHSWLYRSLARWIDPATLSKILPHAQHLLLLAALAATALALSGPLAAWATLSLALSSYLFLDGMVGGLARSWGYPLVALALLALARGHPPGLAVVTWLGAALYPPAGVLSGTALAILLLGLPAADRGAAGSWSAARRLALLGVTMIVSCVLLLPMVVAQSSYGPRIGPADLAAFPEAGPGGRWAREDRPPFPPLPIVVGDLFGRTLQGDGPSWIPGVRFTVHGTLADRRSWPLVGLTALVGLAVSIGLLLRAKQDEAVRRLLVLLVAAAVDYVLADWLQPRLFIPQRYPNLVVPIGTVVALPLAARALASLLPLARRSTRSEQVALLALTGVVLVFLGGRGGTRTGLTVQVDSGLALYGHVSRLPVDSLLAGWPDGFVQNVPYVCRRRALLTWESHQAFFAGYVLEMRRRMRDLLGAYYAESLGPILALGRRYGVTHLVIDTRHFGRAPPEYFAPFAEEIRKAHARARGAGFPTVRLASAPGAVREGTLAIIDLSRLEVGR